MLKLTLIIVATLGLVAADVQPLHPRGHRERRQSELGPEGRSPYRPLSRGQTGKSESYESVPPVLSERDFDAYEPKGYKKPGRVGPVYTFVKTDYHGNAKWGVRHVVGKKYAGHH